MYRQLTEDMLSFIQKNPTAFHTIASLHSALDGAGFQELLESGPWKLEKGRGYYVCRNGSSIVAFRLGTELDGYS